ncbi:hypothetical protein [Cupriavidus sp. UYPR2.512]|uniref:hypothetical protein n=1 Tax=Cupriavidus sp. UYPR2.512 TaxID=1080187 RepID=UPI0003730AED|nr:hypothetical protein [Cupriavidus sp. UYPR2.512]UIF91784.1 hypothetical protein KAF44_36380 [Cupriavidus necator]
MPIDLSPGGEASPYPADVRRFLSWLVIWALCVVVGAAIALLLWPVGVPARGTLFWWRIAGIPNGVFLILLGIARVGYEVQWHRANHWNVHRQKWIDARVREAQRPLQVLGASYCLPLQGHKDLSSALRAAKPLVDQRAPRTRAALIAHSRFDEDSLCARLLEGESPAGDHPDEPVQQTFETVSTIVLKMVDALVPLAQHLQVLSQYGPGHAPAVRVLAEAEMATIRLAQVQEALGRIGFPHLECQTVPASDALMVADAWLDLREWRPLLVIAAEWHDANPPANSGEGCVAVLLNPGCFQLPEPVKVVGLLHRPLADAAGASGDLVANAIRWGKTEPAALQRAWITGLGSQQDIALSAAMKAASLPQLNEWEAQCRVDRIVGNVGAVDPWLSVAAAIESRETGSHLILDRAQAAVLHVLTPPHDESKY